MSDAIIDTTSIAPGTAHSTQGVFTVPIDASINAMPANITKENADARPIAAASARLTNRFFDSANSFLASVE
jgi:hypothetical protein